METLAYLYSACSYEEFDILEPRFGLTSNWKQLSGHLKPGMLMVFIAPLIVVAIATKSLALQVGDQGSAVSSLQQNLRTAGYFDQSPTGYYGSITEQAIRKFQLDRGLGVDGVAGPATLQALSNYLNVGQSTPVGFNGGLRLGSTGSDVSNLQSQLRALGYSVAVDGVFGPDTDKAVRDFQLSRGLQPDGVVGSATKQSLAHTGTRRNSPTTQSASYQAPVQPTPTGTPTASGIGGTTTTTTTASGGTKTASDSLGSKRYVVIVPDSNSLVLSKVRLYVRGAFAAKSPLGNYIQAGAFSNRRDAETRSNFLRSKGLDAQVRYF